MQNRQVRIGAVLALNGNHCESDKTMTNTVPVAAPEETIQPVVCVEKTGSPIMVYAADGTGLLGAVVAGASVYSAYDADHNLIGRFTSVSAATAAIAKHKSGV